MPRDPKRQEGPEEDGVLSPGGMPAQHRALESTRQVAAARGAGMLLESTGPLAALTSADRRGALDDVRRRLIARRAAGVVFEATTVVDLQHVAERFDLDLTAQLSTAPNDPRVDIHIRFAGEEIELQLKTGTDPYLRGSIRAREDGVLMLIPGDAAALGGEPGVVTGLVFDDVEFEAVGREELIESSRHSLERLERGEVVVSASDVISGSLRAAVVDGIVATALNLSFQVLTRPNEPIDWRSAAQALFRSAAVSATASYLAGANALSASLLDGRAIDASRALRGARVAGCVVPHAIDAAFDVADAFRGRLDGGELARRTAGHAGAAIVELVAFRYVARLAARCGPLGIVVMMIGGSVLSFIGRKLGEATFDLVGGILEAIGNKPFSVLSRASDSAGRPQPEWLGLATGAVCLALEQESTRRRAAATRRLCEEPDCAREHHGRGMCGKHYQRWWRYWRRRGYRMGPDGQWRSSFCHRP